MAFRMPKYVFPISLFGTLVGGGVLIKDAIGGPKYTGNEKLVGRTVIITGASSGIGRATARDMAARGAKVIMACRDLDKCEVARTAITTDTSNRSVFCHKCDLASLGSIRAFANYVNENIPRVDILINNAGVMMCPKGYTEEGFETHLGVNHLGPFLLTNLLLDKLKSSAPSRIINVTSRAYMRGEINFDDLNSAATYSPQAAFFQSKLATVLSTQHLAQLLHGTGVTVNVVYPGMAKTDIGRHMSMNKSYISRFTIGPIYAFLLRSPIQAAQTLLYCAIDPALENVTGKYFSDCKETEIPPTTPQSTDPHTVKRLWDISQYWTQVLNTATVRRQKSRSPHPRPPTLTQSHGSWPSLRHDCKMTEIPPTTPQATDPHTAKRLWDISQYWTQL